MSNKEPGYVYILTNPSFLENGGNIGKSSRSVDLRNKEGRIINSHLLAAPLCQKSIETPPAPIKVPSISRITERCWMR